MERKIGEIFEYNGEWLQCVKSDGTCNGCVGKFQSYSFCNGFKERVGKIFKKLEKVGEPYEYFVQHKGIVMLQPYKLFTTPIINGVVCNVNYDTNTIDLEIKQNKEDMEENKLNLKPFNLEAAKDGKPVCTRNGRKARIICFDAKGTHPIIALVSDPNIEGEETPFCYTNDGFYNNPNCESYHDLMMLPEKKEGWVNVYKERIYSTKEEAIEATYDGVTYVDTIKISWEE